jgi:hypothetical protein
LIHRFAFASPGVREATNLNSPVLLPYLPVLPMEEENAITARWPMGFFLNFAGSESRAIDPVYLGDSSFRARAPSERETMNRDTPCSPNKKRKLPR